MLDVHGLLGRLEGARPGAGGFMAKCPAHEDGKASLKIADGDKGIVLYCHAGCSSADILKALGIEWGDLFSEEATKARGEWTPGGEAIAVYDYVDAGGELRYQVLRTADKQFYQRHRDPSAKSGYAWNMRGVGRLPYRLPAVIEAVRAGMTTFIVEGEKDVQACEQQGLVATCNSGGAGKWLPEFAEHFAGGTVVIVADPDDVGRKHARSIMASLAGEVSSVRIVEAAEGSRDAAEHFANGHGVNDFVQTAGPEEPQPDLMEDVLTFIAGEDHWDWITPGLLEHGDRLILTGHPGGGKSVLMRQMAVTLSSGVHPFTFAPITPVRVMVVDCENGETFSRRKYRNLIFDGAKRGTMPDEGKFRIKIRTNGLNLLDEEDVAWLNERLMAYGPDVLFIGPLYKLHHEDPNKAQPAQAVQGVLDKVRVNHGCALIMEAHAPHGSGFEPVMRPEGHASWKRWPEFGYSLSPDREVPGRMNFLGWRGDRDERDWPDYIERGGMGGWPWVSTYSNGLPSHALLSDAVPVEPSF